LDLYPWIVSIVRGCLVAMTTDTLPCTTTPTYDEVSRAISKRSFATLATTSPQQRPHAAGVLYAEVDGVLYVSTLRSSRKARNIAANPNAFVSIPVRRIPFGAPPSSVQFAATAELLPVDHPDVVGLAAAGRLKAITSHSELELPDGCIVRITPSATIHTYGLGMSLRALGKDPLNAAANVVKPV
jgi:Pyridoxamine 5'-phosphate oxidase